MGKGKVLKSVLLANLTNFIAGFVIAWSSPSVPKLFGIEGAEVNPLEKPITIYEESLIVSLVPVGGLFSPFLAAYGSDTIGRKKTLIYSTVPVFIGFVIIAFANAVWQFCIARFLCGLSIGAFFTTMPNYVAEISQKTNRGAMSCISTTCTSVGILVMYIIGSYTTLTNSSLICLIPLVVFFAVFPKYAPETPYYLYAQGQTDEAKICLKKLRYDNLSLIDEELNEIETSIKLSYSKQTNIFDIFTNGGGLKRLSIITGLTMFQQFTGATVIMYYSQKIFGEAGGIISPEASSIIIGVAQLLSNFVSFVVIDRLGRRFLLFTSGFGTLIMLLIIGGYFYFPNSLTWLPVVSVTIFILADSFGFAPVPCTILGEIFPQHMRGPACTITASLNFVLTFVTTFGFPYLLKYLGDAGSFWFFAMFCAGSIFYTFFIVPETKGKSLIEIQYMLDER